MEVLTSHGYIQLDVVCVVDLAIGYAQASRNYYYLVMAVGFLASSMMGLLSQMMIDYNRL